MTSILFLSFFSFFSKTIKRDSPIKKYRVVQTGAKRKLGGVKKGLLSVEYHPVIAGIVKIVPRKPVPSQISTRNNNLKNLLTKTYHLNQKE